MPATDDFKSFAPAISDPVAHASSITPNDGADLGSVTRVVYVGVAGDLRVTMADGAVVTFSAMSAGWHPIRVARVHASGTTATHIIGAW